ncbi:OLC1v1005618C1 [Oldenlandia corymbosa var. corymbosa]|uniref:OLC1v1005618C1 n=1 Tax=Oldenlandia corymbosa var. corymbosa TaxID=529605 RepID=A0AAV1DF44_OLDCO|nr:OLC1v1005618C1 [Oldenlandia corymbosa var. corymbosa]
MDVSENLKPESSATFKECVLINRNKFTKNSSTSVHQYACDEIKPFVGSSSNSNFIVCLACGRPQEFHRNVVPPPPQPPRNRSPPQIRSITGAEYKRMIKINVAKRPTSNEFHRASSRKEAENAQHKGQFKSKEEKEVSKLPKISPTYSSYQNSPIVDHAAQEQTFVKAEQFKCNPQKEVSMEPLWKSRVGSVTDGVKKEVEIPNEDHFTEKVVGLGDSNGDPMAIGQTNGAVKKRKKKTYFNDIQRQKGIEFMSRECVRNHLTNGCVEFKPSTIGSSSDPDSIICSDCGCQRIFHRKIVIQPGCSFDLSDLPPPPPPMNRTPPKVRSITGEEYKMLENMVDVEIPISRECEDHEAKKNV